MIVRLEDIAKSYGPTTVLEGLDLVLPEGETTALVGASGSGKTTILNIIAGLVEPSAGRVFFGDTDVTALAPAERGIGYVFQSYALFPHLDVLGNVAFGPRMQGLSRSDCAARAHRALDRVRMGTFSDRPVGALSGGQRQRVALARALASEPQVLLLDEPLSALDPMLREGIREELRDLLAPLGVTTVLVTHDKADAFSLADWIVMLDSGAVAQAGTPRDLYRNPATLGVATFFGTVNEWAHAGGPAMLRSEQIELAPEGASGAIAAEIRKVTYLGDRQRLTCLTSEGLSLVVDIDPDRQVAEAERIALRPLAGQGAGRAGMGRGHPLMAEGRR